MPLHDVRAFRLGDPLAGLADGGTVFLQSPLADPAAVWAGIPEDARRLITARRMQGIVLLGVFLRAAPLAARRGLAREAVLGAVERALRTAFGKRGEAVVRDNLAAVTRGYDEAIEVSPAAAAPAPAAT